MTAYTGLEVAVIGLSGRFPDADNIGQFWDNLTNGRNCITQFSEEEALAEDREELVNDPSYVKAHAYLKNKQHFDAAFFSYRPDEATLMDPQTRLFHECCWEALEDSGYSAVRSKEKIGVFAAGSPNPQWILYAVDKNKDGRVDDFTAAHLRDITFLASRISYKLNLKGPSVYMQTACSSSLVAIHEACKSLLLGECNMALAGGVNVQHFSKKGYLHKEGMIYSRDGLCRPFDSNSSGTVSGEGAGVVVLKKLKDAINDRDHIYAVIKGSAVNNDGSNKVGFTAPGVTGQSEVIKRAHRVAGITADTISCIETHGTATELGDAIEIEALNKAFGFDGTQKTCAIGSVKSNIGHLDSAAGVAGFIKTVLALKNRQIPPSLHFNEPNPKVPFNDGPFYVNNKLADWKRGSTPLRAGVSSFGIGGTNAHVVLEEAPAAHTSSHGRTHQLLVLSAQTSNSLEENTARLANWLQENKNVNLADVAYALQTGRERFKHRKAVVCDTTENAIDILKSGKGTESGVSSGREKLQQVVFMFPGQGAQYFDMCKDLYLKEKVFKNKVDECLQITGGYTKDNLLQILFSGEQQNEQDPHTINNTRYTQPLLFIIEYSLAHLLMEWGIRPDYMIGHSIGEYVAACISGVLSLNDALRLVISRGRLISNVEKGSMLSVNIGEEALKPLLAGWQLDIAAVNNDTSVVLSGKTADIESFAQHVTSLGHSAKQLHTSHAFHSYMMESILAGFEHEVAAVTINAPRIPYISNITGTWVSYEQLVQTSYWSTHVRGTVNFLKGTETLLQQGNTVFIEVGPGKTLCNHVAVNKLKNDQHHLINTVRQAKQSVEDDKYLAGKLGQLWVNGIDINWKQYYSGEERNRIPLPAYAFEQTTYITDFNSYNLLAKQSDNNQAVTNSVTSFIYVSGWKRSIAPKQVTELKEQKHTFLIVYGRQKTRGFVGKALAVKKQQVVEVWPGAGFKKLGQQAYEINFTNPQDLQLLWADLNQQGIQVQHVLYCAGIHDTFAPAHFDSIEEKLEETYLGICYLAKSIADSQQTGKIHITIIGNYLAKVTGADQVDALKATLHAPAKIIPSEINNITCKVVDIPYPFTNEQEQVRYSEQLINELFYHTGEPFVAYRFDERWTQSFDKLPLDEQTTSDVAIVQNGTYLVTGGFGGIGFSLAQDLVLNKGANVILVHRTEFPDREIWEQWIAEKGEHDPLSIQIRQLLQMEATGCTVMLQQLDVSNEQQVKAFATSLQEQQIKINGLIWSAGEIDYGGIILNRSADNFTRYSTSKIHGLLLFQKYLPLETFDFVALFSSLGNVLYQVKFGQVGYNAANEFLEHYAHHLRKSAGIHAFTINWCDWLDVGLTVKSVIKEQRTTDIKRINAAIDNAITPAKGISLFYTCLAHKAPVYTIHHGDLQADIQEYRNRVTEMQKMHTAAVVPGAHTLPPANDLERTLIDLYRDFFGKNDITADDDFFELGGDSLKAMTLVAQISQKTGINITISDMYKNPAIRDLLTKIASGQVNSPNGSIPVVPAQQYYATSAEQKRMYFLQTIDEASTLYNETELLWLIGALDKDRLEWAFTQLIRRHESLRSSYVEVDGTLKQIVAEGFRFKVEHLHYEEGKLDEIIQSFIQPFNLSDVPLIRIGLVEKSPEEHLLIMDSHHIVMDGVSRFVLREEFNALYNNDELPELRVQYKDYAAWQQSPAQQAIMAKQKAFWLNEFSNEISPLALPTDYKRPLTPVNEGDVVQFELNPALVKGLKKLAGDENTTVFTVLLAALNVLLSKLGNQEDIVVGVPVAGRPHADLQNLIGMFVNTLALRNCPAQGLAFNAFLADVKSKSLACFENQLYPFEELVNELKVERNTGRNPLFDVMFVYQNYADARQKANGLTMKPQTLQHSSSRFDITLLAVEETDRVAFRLIYSRRLFDKETIARFARYLESIIESVVTSPALPIAAINIVNEQEQYQLLKTFSGTCVDQEQTGSVIHLFEQQVARHGSNTALVCGKEKVTYEELNNKANIIAHAVSNKIKGRTGRVGLLFNTSVDMIAAMLGVMKTGCTYLPLSPETPVERNKYILADADADLLLLHEELCDAYSNAPLISDEKLLVVNKTSWTTIAPDYPAKATGPEDIVYIIYTSGTTGNPKGVAVKQKGLTNYATWSINYHELLPQDVGLQLLSYHFDGFAANSYPTLLSGGTMVLIPAEHKLDSPYIVDAILLHKATYTATLPGLYGALLDELDSRKQASALRFIVLAGEMASKQLIRKSYMLLPNARLENEYGPTETTIGSTHNLTLHEDNNAVIGKPIWNTAIYILGKEYELLPIGVPGEIFIAGEGVAQGYVNNKAMTSERFLPDPFVAGQTMYKTGDLGRWLSNGEIEYLGRIDHQVKIRGFRIELEEIECTLAKHPLLKQNVVIASGEEGNRFLVAYYVSETNVETTSLRNFLLELLPDYMAPSFFVRLPQIPLTINGKLDRDALPAPQPEQDKMYASPATETEKILAEVWGAVLGIEAPGITDNFFAIGGDSIKSIQISARLRNKGYDISVKDIFNYPTIARLAGKLKTGAVTTDQSLVTGSMPLTPIQQWFFETSDTDLHHFNQSVLLHFPEGLSMASAQKVFGALQEHHDALRMVFTTDENGAIQQYNAPVIAVAIEEFDYRNDENAAESIVSNCDAIRAGLDLQQGPLMKLGLFQVKNGSKLFITIHHLVIDGVSWRILLEDIERMYQQDKKGQAFALPLKTDSYKSWATHMIKYAGSKMHRQTKAYWDPVSQPYTSILPDNPEGSNTFGDLDRQSFTLNKEITEKLLKEVHRPFGTQVNDILLAALLSGIRRQYGSNKIQVDIEGHGREDIQQGINVDRTVGWFTSIYPVVLQTEGEQLADIIKQVKDTLRKIPNNGIDYLVWKYATGGNFTGRTANNSRISYNYLGQFDSDLQHNSFQLAQDDIGNDISNNRKRAYDLDVSGIIVGGQLQISLLYSRYQYSTSTINDLVNAYQENLLDIIDYCCNYSGVERSPSDFTYKELSIQQLNELQEQYQFSDIYTLSPLQEGMLFHALAEPDSGNYYGQMTFCVEGNLNMQAAEQSVNDLIARHDILRTAFLYEGYERPLQIVLQERKVPFTYTDIQHLDKGAVAKMIQSCQQEDRAKGFDLHRDVLMRLQVLHTAENKFVFIWSYHHILMDGWCTAVILREFRQLYASHVSGITAALPPANNYAKYMEWLDRMDKDAAVQHWKNYLNGYEQLATLPQKELLNTDEDKRRHECRYLHISKENTEQLLEIARANNVTLNTVMQAAWGMLLTMYNNVTDVVFGAVVSGRPPEIEGIEDMIGLFINTVPVRVRYGPDDAISDLLYDIHISSVQREAHQYYSLSEIQAHSSLRSQLLDHILIFENYPSLNDEGMVHLDSNSRKDFVVSGMDIFEQTNYDLVVVILPGDEIGIKIEYNAIKYEDEVIENALLHFNNIIGHVIKCGEEVNHL